MADELADAATATLMQPGWRPAEALEHVPNRAGLYAVRGEAETWRELGLGEPPDDRPLYIGKAERSLQSRDLKTHFATGKTGHSTLRRSIAACLRDVLHLDACPRNVAKPGYFSNYGLMPASDARLSEWMNEHLRLAVWASPGECVLGDVETAVLARLLPPLNLDKVDTPWRAELKARRALLAAQASAWRA